ncbi:unnamed protein product, partial [Candidula unifasciata]
AIGKDEDGGGSNKNDEEANEIEEARREMEEKRKEKHRKMEEERESMRQGIRDKYGLKKKEERQEEESDLMTEGRVGRKKKTPAELAAEAHKDDTDEDEFANKSLCDEGDREKETKRNLGKGGGEWSHVQTTHRQELHVSLRSDEVIRW